MPFHSDIQPHMYGPTMWAAFIAFCAMAGYKIKQVVAK